MPGQNIWVARSTVNIADKRVKLNDRGGKLRLGFCDKRVEGYRAGKIVKSKIQARACLYQLLNLGVRFGPSQIGVQVDKNNLRNRKPQRAAKFTSHKFSYQCLWTLSSPTKFQDIKTIVIGFDNSWE